MGLLILPWPPKIGGQIVIVDLKGPNLFETGDLLA
jgi:hypothetical protein